MRLLPPKHEGAHEAFPPPDEILKRPYAGVLNHETFTGSTPALVPLLIGAALKLPRVGVFGFELGAYGTLAWAAQYLSNIYGSDQARTNFLQVQGIDVPQQKVYDRLAHWDVDNSFLLGAALGIGLAARSPTPFSGPAWKRLLTAGALGGSVASYTHCAVTGFNALRDPKVRQKLPGFQAEQMGWSATIVKTAVNLQEMRLKAQGVKVPDAPTMSPYFLGNGTFAVRVDGSQSDRYKIGFNQTSWDNAADEPHLTSKSQVDGGPVPYANTNYLWKGTAEDLHAYISNLRAMRQTYAQEAEVLWQCMAKKEAEMYSHPVLPIAESEERLAARRYAEVVGNLHTKVWLVVSKCDWMIADARKRCAQLEATPDTARDERGPASSRAPLSVQPARAEYSLPMLRSWLMHEEERLRQCQAEKQSLEGLQRRLVNDAVGTGTPESGKGKMEYAVRELTASAVKKVESALDAANFDVDVIRRVIQEVEQLPKGL